MAKKKRKNTDYRSKYYDLKQPTSYSGKTTFLRGLRPRQRPSAESWLDTQAPYLAHKQVPKKFKRLRVVAGFQQQLQGDLVDVSSLAKHNSKVRYLLTVVDAFSRKAFVEPLLTKDARSVAKAFENILNGLGFRPIYFNSDQGAEFVNGTFKKLLQKHNIDFFTSQDKDIKGSLVERFNRTLMSRIHRYLTKQNSHRYLDALPDIIANYNQTPHNSLGLAPANVTHKNKERVWLRLSKGTRAGPANKNKPKFKVGDPVLIPKRRKTFAKGYHSGWTGEIFKIKRIRPTKPFTYDLEDLQGEAIKGVFYRQELQNTPWPEFYEIESVLDKKGDQLLVKWRHYPKKFNEWVPSHHVRDI